MWENIDGQCGLQLSSETNYCIRISTSKQIQKYRISFNLCIHIRFSIITELFRTMCTAQRRKTRWKERTMPKTVWFLFVDGNARKYEIHLRTRYRCTTQAFSIPIAWMKTSASSTEHKQSTIRERNWRKSDSERSAMLRQFYERTQRSRSACRRRVLQSTSHSTRLLYCCVLLYSNVRYCNHASSIWCCCCCLRGVIHPSRCSKHISAERLFHFKA